MREVRVCDKLRQKAIIKKLQSYVEVKSICSIEKEDRGEFALKLVWGLCTC